MTIIALYRWDIEIGLGKALNKLNHIVKNLIFYVKNSMVVVS
jgi:hypothetical protein